MPCCKGFKVNRFIFFLTLLQSTRTGWVIWNTIHGRNWPESLQPIAKVTVYSTLSISGFLLFLSLISCWSVSFKFKRITYMMWWMMYSTTILDVLNNICFLSMSGFGIESFIGQCMSDLIDDESIWNTCQLNQDCPEWFRCQNEWKIHMISNSIITIGSFFINCVFVYCLHIAHIRKSSNDHDNFNNNRSIIKAKADLNTIHDDFNSKKIQIV